MITLAIELIAAERERQVGVEGFGDAHDDEHIDGELCGAAAAYADFTHRLIATGVFDARRPPGQTWRWSSEFWKPSPDPIRNLVKAGALIVAEIDRILRERAAP